jgi:tryptophan-rich sensory protein
MAYAAATDTRRFPSWSVWLGFVVLCNATGLLSSLTAGEAGLYRELERPSWAPPGSVFGPVWTVLYTLMGTATWLVWTRGRDRSAALAVFAFQLVTNFLWTPVFFGLQQYGLAVIVIVLNWIAVLAMALTYGRQNRLAGWLVVPTLLWVTFATALNVAIWQLNR